MYAVEVTADVFQLPMFWLKATLLPNMLCMLVTAETSHAEMSGLQVLRARHGSFCGGVGPRHGQPLMR